MNREEMLKRLEAGEDPLELSIEKWEDIASGKGEDLGEENCALCQTYANVADVSCKGCPVKLATGGSACVNTPYEEYIRTFDPKKGHKFALEEVEFLKSLRKEVSG